MASTLSIDLASSQLPRSFTWPCCSVQKLVRAASFRCRTKSKSLSNLTPSAPSTLRPRCRADTQPLYGSRDANGWGMVPVLNELLDVTASQQSTSLSISKRSRCINCKRKFSIDHAAASRPQDGYCSIDCRTSHEYMTAIEADVDGILVSKSSLRSTLDSSYSSVDMDPTSRFTFAVMPPAISLSTRP